MIKLGADFIEAEKRLRKIISSSAFTFNGKKYKAGNVYKPQKQGAGKILPEKISAILDNFTDLSAII